MPSDTLVNTGPGNGLLHAGMKLLPEQVCLTAAICPYAFYQKLVYDPIDS